MPIALSLARFGPFQLYRDPSLAGDISQFDWTDPLYLGRLERPSRLRPNLFPNPSWEVNSTANVTVNTGNFTPSSSTDRSSGGSRSLLLTPLGTVPLSVSSATDAAIYCSPERVYSCGIDVFVSGADKTFTLTFTVGSNSGSITRVCKNGQWTRLEVLGILAPPAQALTSVTNFDVYASLASWSLAGDNVAQTEKVYLDRAFVGEGRSALFVDYLPYLTGDVSVLAQPLRLWIKNNGTATLKNIRAHVFPLGALATRPWVDMSTDPDLVGWSSAYNRSVLLRPAPMNVGASFSFWLRSKVDETALPGLTHRAILRVVGDT